MNDQTPVSPSFLTASLTEALSKDDRLFHEILMAARVAMHIPYWNYGPYLDWHSDDVVKEYRTFLVFLKIDPYLAKRLSEEAFLHDIGKLDETQSHLYKIGAEKPAIITEEDRLHKKSEDIEKAKHVEKGEGVLHRIVKSLGHDWDDLPEDVRLRLEESIRMQKLHHTPYKDLPEYDLSLEALKVVDTVSGKMKGFGLLHHTGGLNRHEGRGDALIKFLSDGKNPDLCHPEIVRHYVNFCVERGLCTKPGPNNLPKTP